MHSVTKLNDDINTNVNNKSSTHSMDSDAYLKMLTSNGAFLLGIDQPTRATNSFSLIIDPTITLLLMATAISYIDALFVVV